MEFENCVVFVLVCIFLGGDVGFEKVMYVKICVFGFMCIFIIDLIGLLLVNMLMVIEMVVIMVVVACYVEIECIISVKKVKVFVDGCLCELYNINCFVGVKGWNICLFKIGYIEEVGCCLVMCMMNGKWFIIVVLFDVDGLVQCLCDVVLICKGLVGVYI